MSDSEDYESAKDEESYKNEESETSDDEPLATKKSASPKKSSPSKSSSKKKGRPKKEEPPKKKGRVSFSLVPTKSKAADNEEEEYEVEAIVGHREYNGKLMYKIRWKNYGPVDDTWESHESLSCPDLLEAYNFKHDIVIPKLKDKKRKSKSGGSGSSSSGRKGRPKGSAAPKKRRSSIEETDDEEEEMYSGDSGDENQEYEVNNIVQMRFKKDGTREFLVHWKRWSSHYDTWEPESNLSCPEIIEKFMKKMEEDKNLNPKELRATRKHTQRFTLNTHDSGRRLSKRNNKKLRVTYYGDEKSDED